MNDLADLDIFTPANYTDGFPHDLFTRLRAEDPVHWTTEALTPEFPFVRTPGRGFWAVTRHADVDRVVRTPAVFSSHLGATLIIDLAPGPLALQQRQMINLDPPEHSRLRRIINRAFTPKAVEGLRAAVEANTSRILDAAGQARRGRLRHRRRRRAPTDDAVRPARRPAGGPVLVVRLDQPDHRRRKPRRLPGGHRRDEPLLPRPLRRQTGPADRRHLVDPRQRRTAARRRRRRHPPHRRRPAHVLAAARRRRQRDHPQLDLRRRPRPRRPPRPSRSGSTSIPS